MRKMSSSIDFTLTSNTNYIMKSTPSKDTVLFFSIYFKGYEKNNYSQLPPTNHFLLENLFESHNIKDRE